MAGAALLGRLTWRVATIVAVRAETSRAKTLVLDVPGWPGHRGGQHVDVRLTADDGYQAERSYSIASAASGDTVELTVELVEDGEVSPYLTGEARQGDQFELRGPIGGYFVWEPQVDTAVLLVGGGSGIVPLMAMVRQRATQGDRPRTRLFYSARAWDDVIYRDELEHAAAHDLDVVYTLTRAQPEGWTGYARRVDRALLGEVAGSDFGRIFICGPTPFVESVADILVELGHDATRIKTERFGPTGA